MGKRFFSLSKVQIGYRAHPAFHSVSNMNSFPWNKMGVWKVDQLPVSGVKVKNEWRYTSAPPYAFMICKGSNLPLWRLCA